MVGTAASLVSFAETEQLCVTLAGREMALSQYGPPFRLALRRAYLGSFMNAAQRSVAELELGDPYLLVGGPV